MSNAQLDNSMFLMPPPPVSSSSTPSAHTMGSDESPASTMPSTPAEGANLPQPPSSYITVKDEARLTDADIDNLISSLQPHEELDKLRNIEKTIRETQQRRKKEEEEMRAKIHALETSMEDLKKQSTRQAADWRSLNNHAETIEKLDNKNFDLAKKINEQESLLSTMQTQLAQVKNEMEGLEEVDVEDETVMDRDALCLKIFRSLGFLPAKPSPADDASAGADRLSDSDSAWNSILVRSDTRNTAIQFDITTAHLKSQEISPLILADQMWRAAE